MIRDESMDEGVNIVYGRLLESVHISGYSFKRVMSELGWLLEEDRWMEVGPGYRHINDFLASLDLSPFNMGITERRELVQRLTDLQATQRPIAQALGVSKGTVSNDLGGQHWAPEAEDEREGEPPSGQHWAPEVGEEYQVPIPEEVYEDVGTLTPEVAQEAATYAMRDPVPQLSRIEEICLEFADVWSPESARQVMEERYGGHHIEYHIDRLQESINILTEYREVFQGAIARKVRHGEG